MSTIDTQYNAVFDGVMSGIDQVRPNEDVPVVQESTEALEEQIRRAIDRETGQSIRNLVVRRSGDKMVLEGRCTTYYAKRLAQHVAMEIHTKVVTNIMVF